MTMKHRYINVIIVAMLESSAMTSTYAQKPVWTFSSPSPQYVTVSPSEKATVTYTITNQSSHPKELVLVTTLPKPRDYPATPGLSSVGCVLPGTTGNVTGTCTLTIDIDGSQIPEGGIYHGPYLCESGSLSQCYQPSTGNRLHVTKQDLTNNYTLGGTIVGLLGTVVLTTNNGDLLTLKSNGFFTFATPVAQGANYGVTIATQPTNQVCSVANGSGTIGEDNVTNVSVNCVTTTTTTTLSTSVNQLALSVKGLTEYGVYDGKGNSVSSGAYRVITITNTGRNTAENLGVSLPISSSGPEITNGCKNTLAAKSSCRITITPGYTATSDSSNKPCSSGTQPVPDRVQVSASNATPVTTDVVVLNYGCIYQGGYVYALDDTTPITGSVGGKVVATVNQPGGNGNYVVWASNGSDGSSGNETSHQAVTSYDELPGIDETSSTTTGSPASSVFNDFFNKTYQSDNPFTDDTPFYMCNGALDGACNTKNILTFYNKLTTNNTQAVDGGHKKYIPSPASTSPTYYAAGLCTQPIANYSDWYLPAICEMGYYTDSSSSNLTVCGTSDKPTLQNIQSNLIDHNLIKNLSGYFWSSTENSTNSSSSAYYQGFYPTGNYQQNAAKFSSLGVRCSRALIF
jgi:hypothetical protein